ARPAVRRQARGDHERQHRPAGRRPRAVPSTSDAGLSERLSVEQARGHDPAGAPAVRRRRAAHRRADPRLHLRAAGRARGLGAPARSGPAMMTLRQIEIFWAVAHAESLTKASKLLGLAQPSLSQQLAKLEEEVGTRLFNRTSSQLELTDAGRFLLRKAESILADVDEATAGMHEFASGQRGVIAVGALNSIARLLMPGTLKRLNTEGSGIELTIHEVAPAEALE